MSGVVLHIRDEDVNKTEKKICSYEACLLSAGKNIEVNSKNIFCNFITYKDIPLYIIYYILMVLSKDAPSFIPSSSI